MTSIRQVKSRNDDNLRKESSLREIDSSNSAESISWQSTNATCESKANLGFWVNLMVNLKYKNLLKLFIDSLLGH